MENIYYVKDYSYPPCLQSGTTKILPVSNDEGEVLDKLLIMLETQNLAHMFGGTCDHKLLGQWAKGPPNNPYAGARMKGA